MNTGSFAISIHILTLLAHDQQAWMSSSKIAKSININPVLVRKELAKLKKAKLILVKEGNSGGSKLAKVPEDLYLSEIFKANQASHIFKYAKNEPNPDCPIGKSINKRLNKLYTDIDDKILIVLKNKSLQEFIQ